MPGRNAPPRGRRGRGRAGGRLGAVKDTIGKKISLISEAIDAGRKAAGEARSERVPATIEEKAE